MGGLFSSEESKENYKSVQYNYRVEQNRLRRLQQEYEEYERYENEKKARELFKREQFLKYRDEEVRKRNETRHNNSLIISKVSLKHNILNIEEFNYSMNTQLYSNIPLLKNTPEYQTVHKKFRTTTKPYMKIMTIEKIDNPHLLALYRLKKSEMNKVHNRVSERLLFHGTLLEYLPNICANNFNWRLCGISKGTKFGKGVSFSPFAFYASHYCDKNLDVKIMILSRVLVGNEHIGDTFTRVPSDGFDTTRNLRGDVIVKYEDDTFYPEYIIYFVVNK